MLIEKQNDLAKSVANLGQPGPGRLISGCRRSVTTAEEFLSSINLTHASHGREPDTDEQPGPHFDG